MNLRHLSVTIARCSMRLMSKLMGLVRTLRVVRLWRSIIATHRGHFCILAVILNQQEKCLTYCELVAAVNRPAVHND